jgi:hypothetical protein
MTLSKNARVAGLLYLLGSLFGIVRCADGDPRQPDGHADLLRQHGQ